MRLTRRNFTTTIASILAGAQIGCITTPDRTLLQNNLSQKDPTLLERLPLVNKLKKKEEGPVPYPNPVKLAATWTPDTLIQTGRTPTRGFGGRVFFYDEKSRPVPVEGTLTIHGFDDSAASPEEGVKRFVFTPEQFTRHFGQTDLGASYSIWIPWDAVGGDQKRISLVTSFATESGVTIQGIPATLLLPGKDTNLNSADEVAVFSPQYQDYLAATQSGSTPTTGLTTTTIRRRRPSPVGIEPPVTIPSRQQLLAEKNQTQSFDLQPNRRRSPARRTTILPASAEAPLSPSR